jgi:radical SAM superfamily enzyme
MVTLNKPIPDATYLETCRLLRKYRIHYMTNIMFALPNETLEHAVESIRFNRALRPLGTKTCILKMYKGTKLAEQAEANGWAEAEGEFTLKSRDVDNSHDHLENILWAGYLIVVIPGLARFARLILAGRWSKHFRFLILAQHLQDLIFFNIPPVQALVFFWRSRKAFMHGVAGRQVDTYESTG